VSDELETVPAASIVVPPTTVDLAKYIKTDRVSEDDLGAALSSALGAQAKRCYVDYYSPELFEAALRRAARILAARGAPLGALDLGPMGSSPLVRFDAVIEELEGPDRKPGIG